jgi:hypothetical protein
MLKSKFASISMGLIFLLLATNIASAGLLVGNAILEKDIAPGDHISHLMTVTTRDSDPSMDFKVEVMGYGQSPDGSNNELNASQDTSPYTARPFLKVSTDSFHLDPGKSQQITLDGDIPKDVGSGSRYALVNIQSLPLGNQSVNVILAVDVPVRLTINGSEILNKGEIESINLVAPVSADKQMLSLILKNTGNHHYKAQVYAEVKDKEGSIVTNASTPLVFPILPTYSRLLKLSLTPKIPFKPGTYNVNVTFSMMDGTILANKETSLEIKS